MFYVEISKIPFTPYPIIIVKVNIELLEVTYYFNLDMKV